MNRSGWVLSRLGMSGLPARASAFAERVPAPVMVIGFYATAFAADTARSALTLALATAALVALALYTIARGSLAWNVFSVSFVPFMLSAVVTHPHWLPWALAPLALAYAVWRERVGLQEDEV